MLSFLISPALFQHILRTDFLSVVFLAPLLLNSSPGLSILLHLRKSQIKKKKKKKFASLKPLQRPLFHATLFIYCAGCVSGLSSLPVEAQQFQKQSVQLSHQYQGQLLNLEWLFCYRRNHLYKYRSSRCPSALGACSTHRGEGSWVSQCLNVPSATMYSLAPLTVSADRSTYPHGQVDWNSHLWPQHYHRPPPQPRSEDKHSSSYSCVWLRACHLFSSVTLRCAQGRGGRGGGRQHSCSQPSCWSFI